MKLNGKWVAITVMGLFLYCCSPKVVTTPTQKEVTVAPQKAPESSGHDLYTEHCGRCHKLYRPEEFSEESWRGIVPGMARKSRLDKQQEEQILNYVLTAKQGK